MAVYPVEGVVIKDLGSVIYDGLGPYQDRLGTKFRIDRSTASYLAKRSLDSSPSRLSGLWTSSTPILGSVDSGEYAQLDIVVLPPNDGTGNYSEFGPPNIGRGLYPDNAKNNIFPLTQHKVIGEAVMSIASFQQGQPIMHAMHLDKTGVAHDRVVQVAELGQRNADFHRVMAGMAIAEPTALLTIRKWEPSIDEPFDLESRLLSDPEAFYNSSTVPQVAGILSIISTGTYQRSIFELLGAEVPG